MSLGCIQRSIVSSRIRDGKVWAGIEYFKDAFGTSELRRWTNPDGSVYLAETRVDSAESAGNAK